MKKYAIGLITGALLAVSAMMFMGAEYGVEVGRYAVINKTTILDTGNGSTWVSGKTEWDEDGEKHVRHIWTHDISSIKEGRNIIDELFKKGFKEVVTIHD